MSELWYYGQQGAQRGPIEIEALRALAAAGNLQPTDLVWREGMIDWVPAQTIDGLFLPAPTVTPSIAPLIATVVTSPVAPPPTAALAYDASGFGMPPTQNGRAVTALVLGILSMPMCFCPFVGLSVGIAAIILGAGVHAGPNKGLAVAGVVCGSVGTLLGLPMSLSMLFR